MSTLDEKRAAVQAGIDREWGAARQARLDQRRAGFEAWAAAEGRAIAARQTGETP